jgi:peptidoglycan-associated lipoprotein
MMWMSPLLLVIGCAHPKPEVKEPVTPPPTSSSKEHATNQQVANANDGSNGADDACTSVRVHFAVDSTDISDGDKPLLEKSAHCLMQDKKLHVTIEGNADERGTEEYNLALGDRRARAVSQYLERLGASGTQIKTVSYGKEQPECNEHNENCWSQNRRAAVKPTQFNSKQ